MYWMLLPLKRYADFQGRSRRKEYWMFVLGYMIVAIALGLLGMALGAFSGDLASGNLGGGTLALFGLLGLLGLALIIPSIAVQVRRFHDQDLSGWFLLGAYVLSLIPILGFIASIALIVFMCLPGTRGSNRFGPDPKENVAEAFN